MKIFLDMVGCRLNQSEIESFARQFVAAGHTLVEQAAGADLVVINTCTVTASAAADSRAKIRQAQRVGAPQMAVTGCWATLEPEAAAQLAAGAYIIPNDEKDDLVKKVLPEYELEPIMRQPIPGARRRTRAFIKVQDGCDNHCTFCVTRLARGASRSRPITDVLEDIHVVTRANPSGAADWQAREIVLSGVHLGSWGQDFSPPLHLHQLIQAILDHTDVERIRLSSLEPWDLSEKFFRLWENPRLCHHLHLPLQSGSSAILQRMGRKTTPEEFRRLVQTAREAIKDLAITTDVIVAFPGEDEDNFNESLNFIEEMQFAGGHVFIYSPRPATPAARLRWDIPLEERKARSRRTRETLERSAQHFRQAYIGKTMKVLWESVRSLHAQGWLLSGLTDNYLRVNAFAP
ncbi:MAG: MiaB/RimO family radical SAM methylthiotransferase, partial [Anaerolineales bacterium]